MCTQKIGSKFQISWEKLGDEWKYLCLMKNIQLVSLKFCNQTPILAFGSVVKINKTHFTICKNAKENTFVS